MSNVRRQEYMIELTIPGQTEPFQSMTKIWLLLTGELLTIWCFRAKQNWPAEPNLWETTTTHLLFMMLEYLFWYNWSTIQCPNHFRNLLGAAWCNLLSILNLSSYFTNPSSRLINPQEYHHTIIFRWNSNQCCVHQYDLSQGWSSPKECLGKVWTRFPDISMPYIVFCLGGYDRGLGAIILKMNWIWCTCRFFRIIIIGYKWFGWFP